MSSKKPTKLRPGTSTRSPSVSSDDNTRATSTPNARSVPPPSFDASSKKVQHRTGNVLSSDDSQEPPQAPPQRPHQVHRRHPGLVRQHPRNRRRMYTNVEREIRKLQKSTELLIPRQSFSRLVREVCSQLKGWNGYRWQVTALEALQEASEYFLIGAFETAQLLGFHAGRVTLMRKDLQLTRRIYCGM